MSQILSDIEAQLNEFVRLNIKECLRSNNFGTEKIISCVSLKGAEVQNGNGLLYFGVNSRIRNALLLGKMDRCSASIDMWPRVAKPGQAMKLIKKYLHECKTAGTVNQALSQMRTEFDQTVRVRLLSKSSDQLQGMLSDLQGVFFEVAAQ